MELIFRIFMRKAKLVKVNASRAERPDWPSLNQQ